MSHFFSKFSTINYTVDGYNKDAENILTSTVLKQLNVNKALLVQNYNVPAGMSPEVLAEELYKDPTLWWTFFLINNKVNPLTDWPMSDEALEEYTLKKYGDVNKILYFVDITKNKRLDDVADAQMREYLETHDVPFNIQVVTALTYESELNRDKGFITVLSPKFINTFVDTFNQNIQGKN